MLGYPVDKTTTDARAAQVVVQVREALRAAQLFQAWLATQTDPALVGLGYTAGEVATLKSAFTDLDELRQAYEGVAALTQRDRRTFAKLLTGTA